MEPCGGTGARSVGMVYVNEWAGFFEKSGSGTVSTGNRWWCHGAGVPPAVPAPMWRSGGDVMHAPGRDVMHWYSINVVAAKCFFETIFFANQFTIFRIFKDSNFKRKFWTYYFFNNPTFRTVQIGLHLLILEGVVHRSAPVRHLVRKVLLSNPFSVSHTSGSF